MTIAQQFQNSINAKTKRAQSVVPQTVATEISTLSIQQSKAGKGFSNDRYDNTYNAEYAKRNKKPRTPVILRNKKRRIERQIVVPKTEKKSEISFQQAGRIFLFHHRGIKYKNGFRQRSIFPQSVLSVPKKVHKLARTTTTKAFNGAK